MAPAAGSLLCGAAILIPLSLVVEQPWTLAPSTNSLLALLGLAVFSTAFAFVIYFRLIQTLGSVGTTAQAYLRVPIGVALERALPRRAAEPDGLDRAWLCRHRRRRDDDPGEEAEAGRGGGVNLPPSPATRTLAAAIDYRHPAGQIRAASVPPGDGRAGHSA